MENNSTKKIIVIALALVSLALFVVLGVRGCSSSPEPLPEDESDYGYVEPEDVQPPVSQADVSSGDWVMDDNATEEMDSIPADAESAE